MGFDGKGWGVEVARMVRTSTHITVVCPNCGKDMYLYDDGYYYCSDYLISEVDPNAIDCFGLMTYHQGQEQWKRRVKAERAKLKEWRMWAAL